MLVEAGATRFDFDQSVQDVFVDADRLADARQIDVFNALAGAFEDDRFSRHEE